jgi:hypothetical protein
MDASDTTSSLSSIVTDPSLSGESSAVLPIVTPIQEMMPLPPEATYSSKALLFDAIQAFAKNHNYAFRTGRSKQVSKTRYKVFYDCDRGGPVPPLEHPRNRPRARINNTTTRKTGCLFSIVAVEIDANHWELRHRPDPKFAVHNHLPSHSIISHSVHRKLPSQELQEVQRLFKAGKKYLSIILSKYYILI